MFKYVLHFEGIGKGTAVEYNSLHLILQQNNLTVIELMAAISPKCSDMLERCMWKGTQTRCDNLFQEVNTTEGVCCSFNNHAMKKSNFAQYLQSVQSYFPIYFIWFFLCLERFITHCRSNRER